MLIIFFVAAVPKTANASQKRCASTFFFMPSHYVQSRAKPTGSKVKEQLQKCESKGIAASQRTRPPKDYGIKTQPQHTEAIIFIPFPFGLSHLPQRLVAKHFLLHFIFYHN
jgi:hypothetical protein